MSPFFKDTVAALLQCAQRHAHHEHAKVQISAFEAINDLVRSASRDTLDIVAQLIQVGGDRDGVSGGGGQVWTCSLCRWGVRGLGSGCSSFRLGWTVVEWVG